MEQQKVVKGYKVFNPDFTCRGFKFEVGKTYEHKGRLSICESGFHFCLKASDCFSYYSFDPKNIVCEVEAQGDTQFQSDDSKVATDILTIVRRLEWHEVLFVANEGVNNTGYRNSGNWNSGDSNPGNRNSGNWNSGNWNSGYRNSGNWNSGDRNSGYRNSGDRNSGYRNSGNWNSGASNSGNRNSGNWNSGNWNSGDRNSGDSNSGYRNSGAFSNDPSPILYCFNKPTKLTVCEWESHEAVKLMGYLEPTIWVPESIMSEEEKSLNPHYKTTEGYLKTITLKEAWKNLWNNLPDDKKNVFLTLPNFDAEIFEDITGIKTN